MLRVATLSKPDVDPNPVSWSQSLGDALDLLAEPQRNCGMLRSGKGAERGPSEREKLLRRRGSFNKPDLTSLILTKASKPRLPCWNTFRTMGLNRPNFLCISGSGT